MSERFKGVISLIAAVFLFLCTDATAKGLVVFLGPMTQAYLRFFIGIIFMLVFLRKFIDLKKLRQMTKKDLIVILLVGALGFGAKSALVAAGLKVTKLINFTTLDSLTPLVVYGYSMLLLGTKFNSKVILATLLSVYGVLVMSTKSLIPTGITVEQGELIILVSILFNAFGYIGRKLLSDRFNTFEITFYTMIIASFTLFLFAPTFGEKMSFSQLNQSVIVLLVLGAICTTFASIFMNYGVKRIEPILVSQLLLTKIIFSLIVGLIFFREIPKGIELVGIVVIIVGVYLANIFTYKKEY